MTKAENKGVSAAGRESSSSTRRKARGSTGVMVYSECSVTLCVDRTNSQFVKFTFGHERLSPSDAVDALRKTEAQAWEFNESVVDKRVRKLQRLIRQIGSE